MSFIALSRVNFSNPPGDLGDRVTMAMSTAIANEEWHLEANSHFGAIGDVHLYRNTNHNTKGAAPNWVWYGAIPTANIKGYTVKYPTAPQALTVNEPQAENPTAPSATTRAAK